MPPVDDTVSGFIEEVKGYIDPIIEGIEALKEKPDQADMLEETHRLVHTIKGASSLLDFMGLSHIAGQMEKALDDLFSGELVFSDKVFDAMMHTVNQIQRYCEGVLTEEVDDKALLKETVAVYRRMRDLPAEDDEEVFRTIWESEPGLEAGVIETDKEDDGETTDAFKELIESFYTEAEEHMENTSHFLNILDSQVKALTDITPAHREAIGQIRRSVHTVKGAAGMVKLNEISKWAHDIEDMLDWLYEEAQVIDRKIITLLYEATDMLGLFVTNPKTVDNELVRAIRQKFQEITGQDGEEFAEGFQDQISESETDGKSEYESAEIFSDATERVAIEDLAEDGQPVVGLDFTKTLRVNMDKVDDLVNLAGELSIALSGCEQKMETFTNSLDELELSRDRLRTIARDLETDYEVKAIQGLGSTFASSASEDGDTAETDMFEEFDTLELDRYTEFNLLIRSLAESVVDMGAINTQMLSVYSELEGFLNRQRVLLSELQNKMMLIRMTPMSSISNRMRQTVREVSRDLGKQVRFIIEGEEIELDRQIWDRLTDPLMHILRNAVDHGIETKDRRQALGKPPFGTIKVRAAREGNQVVIRIADDGAGIDHQTIRETMQRTTLSYTVDEMSEEELISMIFQPGFSTAKDITQFSGRGVGLDVVKENIETIKGTIGVSSAKDKGVQFTIRIPLTLAVAEALLFTLGKRKYAIALNNVSEVFRVDPGRITDKMEGEIEIEDEVLPMFNLIKYLNVDTDTSSQDHRVVLVLEIGDRRFTVVIEDIIGKREIVIKSLGTHLTHVKGVSAATILGDGSVVPILDIEELVGTKPLISEIADQGIIIAKPLEILVVDDSVSVRQVVARLMESQGWKTQTAKDGVEALEVMRENVPDLVILDIEMPRMNGYEFLNAINVQPHLKKIPVVMLTSRATKKHREKAMSLGAKGFVVKPYKDDEFVDIVLKLAGEGN